MRAENQDSAELDEVDLALINTLQLDARASWTTVGRALGLDPVTVARRWSRLTESGAAWVTVQPTFGGCAAFIELDCASELVRETAARLASWPHVLTVEFTSGGRDLLLTVDVADLTALSRYVLGPISGLAGVRSTRTHPVTRVYSNGSDWQLRALDAQQRAGIGEGLRAPRSAARPVTPTERHLLRLLSEDGRAALTVLAARLSCSVNTVRRRIKEMVEDRLITFRCDVAQPLSGWPVSFWLWASIPTATAKDTARRLATLPETRACVGITGGASNFLHCAWLRSLDDAQRLEELLVERMPGLVVIDRAVSLGYAKRMGRLLDDWGRSTGCVPMDIWADPVEAARR